MLLKFHITTVLYLTLNKIYALPCSLRELSISIHFWLGTGSLLLLDLVLEIHAAIFTGTSLLNKVFCWLYIYMLKYIYYVYKNILYRFL